MFINLVTYLRKLQISKKLVLQRLFYKVMILLTKDTGNSQTFYAMNSLNVGIQRFFHCWYSICICVYVATG